MKFTRETVMTRKTRVKTTEHPILRGMESILRVAKHKTKEGYLKTNKRIIPDIFVTDACVEKAVSFANTLFRKLQREGYQVYLANDNHDPVSCPEYDLYEDATQARRFKDIRSPWKDTLTNKDGVSFGIKIFEMLVEETAIYAGGDYIRESLYTPELRNKFRYHHSWETKMDFPTGRLCLMVYSYDRWVCRWTETKGRQLEAQIPKVLETLNNKIPELLNVRERLRKERKQRAIEWEESKKQWEIEREQSLVKEATNKSKDWIEKIIVNWSDAVRVHDFFTSVEREIAVQDDSRKAYLEERVRLAKDLIGTVDPLDFLAQWETPDEIANKVRQQRQ